MSESNEEAMQEEPTSAPDEGASDVAADPNTDNEMGDLPDWAARQMEQMGKDEAGDGEETAAETAPSDGGDDAGELPDWAVQKIEQLGGEEDQADDDAADTADATDDLPSWAVEKMQQFAEQETPGGQSPASATSSSVAPPVAPDAAPTSTATAAPALFAEQAPNLELMLDLPLDVTVELGHAELPLAHVLELKAGSVVQLDRLPGEPLDLLVNGQLVAHGEIVVLNDTFAFRITDLIED